MQYYLKFPTCLGDKVFEYMQTPYKEAPRSPKCLLLSMLGAITMYVSCSLVYNQHYVQVLNDAQCLCHVNLV